MSLQTTCGTIEVPRDAPRRLRTQYALAGIAVTGLSAAIARDRGWI